MYCFVKDIPDLTGDGPHPIRPQTMAVVVTASLCENSRAQNLAHAPWGMWGPQLRVNHYCFSLILETISSYQAEGSRSVDKYVCCAVQSQTPFVLFRYLMSSSGVSWSCFRAALWVLFFQFNHISNLAPRNNYYEILTNTQRKSIDTKCHTVKATRVAQARERRKPEERWPIKKRVREEGRQEGMLKVFQCLIFK